MPRCFTCGSSKTSRMLLIGPQGTPAAFSLFFPEKRDFFLEGRGVFVIESPVPAGEIELVELDGSREMIVDGDLMLMYSASLKVDLRPLTRGLRNLSRSGEGLVYVIRGRGSVWLTPSVKLGW